MLSSSSVALAQKARPYRLSAVDLKQPAIWGAECREPVGTACLRWSRSGLRGRSTSHARSRRRGVVADRRRAAREESASELSRSGRIARTRGPGRPRLGALDLLQGSCGRRRICQARRGTCREASATSTSDLLVRGEAAGGAVRRELVRSNRLCGSTSLECGRDSADLSWANPRHRRPGASPSADRARDRGRVVRSDSSPSKRILLARTIVWR